jgi:hypothetical protein
VRRWTVASWLQSMREVRLDDGNFGIFGARRGIDTPRRRSKICDCGSRLPATPNRRRFRMEPKAIWGMPD